jgi:hypothetical protein
MAKLGAGPVIVTLGPNAVRRDELRRLLQRLGHARIYPAGRVEELSLLLDQEKVEVFLACLGQNLDLAGQELADLQEFCCDYSPLILVVVGPGVSPAIKRLNETGTDLCLVLPFSERIPVSAITLVGSGVPPWSGPVGWF